MQRASTLRRSSVAVLAAVLLVSCGSTNANPGTQRHVEAPLSAAVARDIAAVEAFWRREIPLLTDDALDPVERVVAYRGSAPRTFPRCNGTIAHASSYAGNAIYCRLEHLIAYDAEGFEQLRADHGPLAIGVVLAHEYAHAIQAQTGEHGATRGLELQADCFSGAWVASGAVSRSATRTDLDAALRSFLDAADADTDGSLVDDPEGHGTTFDRMAAFSDGFHAGGSACVSYDTAPPLFDTTPSAGAPRWDGSIATLAKALDSFWSARSSASTPAVTTIGEEDPEACDRIRDAAHAAAICIVDGDVRYDDDRLRGPVGRWSVGYPVTAAFVRVVLASAGTELKLGTSRLALATDCAIGAFVAASASVPIGEVRTDRRDLDEIVQAMTSFDPAELGPRHGGAVSLLDRVEALRAGVRGGIDDCANTRDR